MAQPLQSRWQTSDKVTKIVSPISSRPRMTDSFHFFMCQITSVTFWNDLDPIMRAGKSNAKSVFILPFGGISLSFMSGWFAHGN